MSALPPLPNEMTIYAVSELRSVWLDWLTALPEGAAVPADGGPVVLDASAVDMVDAAGLQLLVSFRRSLRERGAGLTVSPASEAFVQACDTLGLGMLLSTRMPAGKEPS